MRGDTNLLRTHVGGRTPACLVLLLRNSPAAMTVDAVAVGRLSGVGEVLELVVEVVEVGPHLAHLGLDAHGIGGDDDKEAGMEGGVRSGEMNSRRVNSRRREEGEESEVFASMNTVTAAESVPARGRQGGPRRSGG